MRQQIIWAQQHIRCKQGILNIMVGKIKRSEPAASPSQLLSAMREIVRRAILTLAAVKDPDKRFMGFSSLPQHVVQDVKEAYGYSSASVRSFAPTAYEIDQMEVVLPWLAWLRREEGETAMRRIIGWTMDVPMWRLAHREDCSERTITNRIDRSMSKMIGQFWGDEVEIEYVDEPYKSTPYAMIIERPEGRDRKCVIQKVYVGGVGMMKGGKKLRTAIEAA